MKLRTLLLLLSSLTLLSFSCSNEEKEEPTPPKATFQVYPSDSIDANNDGIIDFYTYSESIGTCDEPQSASTSYRRISPLNGNKILYNFGESFDRFLTMHFFNEGTTIDSEPVGENTGGPFQWSGGSPTLIYINTSYGVLDRAWKIGNTNKTNDFFMAVKLNNVTPSQIGWLLFEFNIYTGAYTIVDKKWTTNTSLVIQK